MQGRLRPILLAIGIFATLPARADAEPELCFDFSRVPTPPLRDEPASFPPEGKEAAESGWRADAEGKASIAWGRVDGSIAKPLPEVIRKLQDPMLTRDPDHTKVRARTVPLPGALLKQVVDVDLRPVFFLHLEWQEEWVFASLEGGMVNPKKVVAAYQKTRGTSHIRRFCGSILLQKLGPDLTGISYVEEIIARRRPPEDVKNGLLGTLRSLRQ